MKGNLFLAVQQRLVGLDMCCEECGGEGQDKDAHAERNLGGR